MDVLKTAAILVYVVLIGAWYWRIMQSLVRREGRYWPIYRGEDIQTIFGKNGANPVVPKRTNANHA